MSDYKVSTYIPDNLPSFVREDYSRFVQFIQDCYKSNERRGSSLDVLRNILSYKNFNQYDGLTSRFTTLQSSIDDNDTQIVLSDASGFPKTNGVIRIEDEIILYKSRNNNTLNGCLRGSSYVTELKDIFDTPSYISSDSTSHDSGIEVEDLTSLALIESLNQTYSTFLSTIPDELIYSPIRRSTILSRISSFYRSKGSEDGIKILFRLLYGNEEVSIQYPGEQILRASDSTWIKRDIIKCELISGDISIVEDNTLYQLTDSYDPELTLATVIVEGVREVSIEGKYIYEISINPDNRFGTIRPAPRTLLTRTLLNTDTVATVESTYGYPTRNGKFYVGSEEIEYSYCTSNQFHELTRQTPVNHTVGENVYGVGFLYAYDGNQITVLRVLGLVSNTDIVKPGLFYQPKSISVGGTGRTSIGTPIIDEWIENSDYELASVFDTTVFDVSKFTKGINSVYFDEQNVFVNTSSLPLGVIGPFGNAGAQNLRPLSSYCIFPRTPKTSTENIPTGFESTGVFVDGVLAQSSSVNDSIISGQITSIKIISPGHGYSSAPSVIVTGGGGSGVVATTQITDGKVTNVIVTNGGSGFTSIPSVRFSTGEGAIATPTIDPYGRLTSITVTNGGNYYSNVPEVILIDPTGRGRGALLSVDASLIVNGVIQSNAIRVINSGIDYSQSSYIVFNSIGTGATAEATVYTYNKDAYRYVNDNPNFDFDSSGGFVYPRQVGSSLIRNTYCYSFSPNSLRSLLNDDGTSHSPILGFAFDGNPIYGPYGFSDALDNTSPIIRMSSSYQIGSRGGTNPPSTLTYPLGTFVEDYVYIQNLGTLDEFNGRYCVTPEYPNGTYAYFITIDELNQPVYPYIIGPRFKSLPASQNIEFAGINQLYDTSRISILNQNFYTENGSCSCTYDYKQVVRRRNSNLDILNEEVYARITSTSRGNIDGVYIDESDDNLAVGDLCLFDYTDNTGGGCEAVVSWVVGDEIISLSMAVPNVKVFIREQEVDLSSIVTKQFAFDDISVLNNSIYFDSPHNFQNGMRVLFTNVSGDIPGGMLDGKAYFVKVIDSTTIQLSNSLIDLQNGVMITITSQGTGNKSLAPLYTITKNQIFTTEGGSEFLVTDWNPVTKIINIKILNQNRIEPGDKFRDLIGATVYFPVNSISLNSIDSNNNEISVDNSDNFRGGDIIQIASETMSVIEILPNNVLLVNRDDQSHPDIQDNTYVVNLSRLAILVTTRGNHNLSVGDVVDIIDATPQFMSGTVIVDNIIDERNFVCLKKLSESDSNYIFEGVSNPAGLAFTTTNNPYFVSNLTNGRLWWSPLTGSLYIYYLDGDSGQWVSAIPTGVTSNHLGEGTIPEYVTGNPTPSGPNVITGGIIQISQTAPITRIDGSSLRAGDFWWSSLTGFLYIYYSGMWSPATPVGTVPRESEGAIVDSIGYPTNISSFDLGEPIERQSVVTISDTPPTSGSTPVQDGDLWWSSYSGFLYIRYNSKWVIATPIGVKPYEGASNSPVSGLTVFDINYLTILTVGGDYYFATTSLGVTGPVYRFKVTVQGSELNILPNILGTYQRSLDRCQLSVNVDNNGSIQSVSVITGGNRYKNPEIIFISDTGTGAVASVNLSGDSVSSIDIINGGEGYIPNEVEALIIEKGNILIPTTSNIGKIENITYDSNGYYQNYDKTLKPELLTDISCTLYNVTGNFVIGMNITNQSSTFVGTVLDWNNEKRLLTLTNCVGFLKNNDLVSNNNKSVYGTVLQSGQPDLYVRTDAIGNLGGKFLTSKSILSSSYQKIIDSYYYQDFSYVIDSNIQIKKYRQLVLDNTHPAGFALFGQLSITDQINTTQCIIDASVNLDDIPSESYLLVDNNNVLYVDENYDNWLSYR